MNDIARRFEQNPLLSPRDLQPSKDGLEITCLLNPGVFRYREKTWLVVRVAEILLKLIRMIRDWMPAMQG